MYVTRKQLLERATPREKEFDAKEIEVEGKQSTYFALFHRKEKNARAFCHVRVKYNAEKFPPTKGGEKGEKPDRKSFRQNQMKLLDC